MNVLYGAPLFALDLRIGNRLKNPPARVFVKDVLSFLDWLRDHAPRLEGPAALQSLAGLRLTEAARVTWNHIDVKHGLVEVSGETKNEFSKRVIPICKRAVEALRRAWALRPVVKVQEMDGGHLATTDTGFHFEGGSFDNYGKILGTAIRSWNADIGWTAKDLRKALPTLAATEGWLSPVVEMYLGHAAKGVTATNYVPRLTSVSPGEKDALERSMAILRDLVVKPLEVAIEKASKPAMVVDAANPTA
jgi:integrase